MAESQTNPETDSQFARSKQLAKDKGTAPGIDPVTGDRASVTYRQIYNETGGDEAKAKEIFQDIARAGGYGDVQLTDTLDIRSASRSVEENKTRADRAVDLFDRNRHLQQAQHQDNVVNAIGEALERLKKG